MTAGLGVPMEYLDVGATLPALARRWGTTELSAYLTQLRRLRSRNGVLGVKVHWHQAVAIANRVFGRPPTAELSYVDARRVLEHLVPAPSYVWIGRGDLDRQTVSHFVALGTGQWVDTGDGGEPPPPPPYDFERLEQIRHYLATCEQAWARYFSVNGIEPLRVEYEDLASDYVGTMAAVVKFLGGSFEETPPPRLRTQSGSRTAALLDRYRADRRRAVAAVS